MTNIIDNLSTKNNPSGMNWYDQTSDDFDNRMLLTAKFHLMSLGADNIVIQGKDTWGVDIILFDWNNYSHELMLVLYDGPGKATIVLNNLVSGKTISFENEENFEDKISFETLKNLI